MKKIWVLSIILILAFVSGLNAFEPMYGYCPETPHDPTVWDGRATTWEEWAWAARFPNWFNDGVYPNAGFFYHEHKHGWQATSSSLNTAFYPGLVYFFAHDIEGEPPPSDLSMFRQRDDNDWNVAEFTYEGLNVKCWVFGGDDALVDTAWIKLSDGLESSHLIPEVGGDNLIDDAESSFIVRFDNDPATDTHWFPGYPEPGDAAWDWSDFYGAFGSYGFNNSFFTTGLDPRPGYEGDNEVYEWAFYWGHEGDPLYEADTVWLPGGFPAPPMLDSTQILVVVIDPPKDTTVYIAPNWWIHFWPPVEWPPFKVDCFPSQDVFMAQEDTVEVNYYIRNMGLEPDDYTVTITDTRAWMLDPVDYQVQLASEDWIILPVSVAVPFESLTVFQGAADTVIMTVQSQGDPSVVEACSLAVTLEPVYISETDPTPTCYLLAQNTPNPFSDETLIRFQIPTETHVNLTIYDAAGRAIITLADETRCAGYHVIGWNGRNSSGTGVPTGVYFYSLKTGYFTATRKMILLR